MRTDLATARYINIIKIAIQRAYT